MDKLTAAASVIAFYRALTSIVLFCMIIITSYPSLAAKNQSIAQSGQEFELNTAPVIVDGNILFNVRGVTGFPAQFRAKKIAQKISDLAADETFNIEDIYTKENDFASTIMAKEQILFLLVDADAALEYMNRTVLAQAYIIKIKQTIEEYRHARRLSTLIKNTIYVTLTGLALAVALFFGLKLYRWSDNKLSQIYSVKFKGLELKSYKLIKTEHIWSIVHALNKAIGIFTAFILSYGYAYFTLSQYPWTNGMARWILRLVIDPINNILTAVTSNIPNIIFLIILYFITRFALKIIRLFFKKIANSDIKLENFEKDWAWPTYRLVRLFVIIFALVISYPYIPGSGSDAFKGISIFIGVLFSLGSSSAIANIIAGYSMIYRRAFQVGDRIKVGEFIGEVTETRLLATYIRTPKNENIVVPNSKILNQEVVNYSLLAREQGIILHTTVGIGYETPWRQVEAMLLIAAERTSGLLKNPKAFVLQQSLGDFAITYEINAYCKQPNKIPKIYSELHSHIVDVFNEYDVSIMTPAYEHDPEEPKQVPQNRWYTAPAKKTNQSK